MQYNTFDNYYLLHTTVYSGVGRGEHISNPKHLNTHPLPPWAAPAKWLGEREMLI